MKKRIALLLTVVLTMSMALCITGAAESETEFDEAELEAVELEAEEEAAEESEMDAVTSASTPDTFFYADYALEGDELMDAINSYSGFYLLCNTNPDGSVQAGFYIYGCVKYEDTYYIQLGLAENQGRENFLANGTAVAVYAAAPSDMPYAMAGAKMKLELVTDEDLLAELNPDEIETALYGEIVDISPLG